MNSSADAHLWYVGIIVVFRQISGLFVHTTERTLISGYRAFPFLFGCILLEFLAVGVPKISPAPSKCFWKQRNTAGKRWKISTDVEDLLIPKHYTLPNFTHSLQTFGAFVQATVTTICRAVSTTRSARISNAFQSKLNSGSANVPFYFSRFQNKDGGTFSWKFPLYLVIM